MAVRAEIERNRQKGLMFKSLYQDPELAKLRKHYGNTGQQSDNVLVCIGP